MALVKQESLSRAVTVSGTLAAEEEAVLSFKVAGRLQELLVDLGSPVAPGQPIARLTPTDYQLRMAQATAALQQARARLGLSPDGEEEAVNPQATAVVRQARAVLDEAKLTRQRVGTFVDRGLSSRSELDAAEASLQVADSRYQDALEEVRNRQAILSQRRSELDLARQALSDTTLTAPFGGIIRARPTALGQYMAAGVPIVTLVRMHPLRLRLEVPERESTRVVINQPVHLRVEGDDEVYEGRIVRLSPAIAELSRTLLVEAEVPNQRGLLRPGSFATADIVTKASESALLVPVSAVVTFAGIDKVIVVKDGKAVEQRIEVGRREKDLVEVLKGIEANQSVVIEPGNLVAGQAVKVIAQ